MTAKPTIICAVTNDLNQDQRMRRVCTTLQRQGYEVTLVGRSKAASEPLTSQPYQQVRLEVEPEHGPWFYFNYNQALLQYLKQQRPDIIYAVDTDTLLACTRAKKKLGCRLVLDAHEYFTEVPELTNKPVKKTIWRQVEKYCLPHTDARITVGPALAKVLTERDRQSYEVIRNVPEKTGKKHERGNSEKIILYQGVLNRGRGLEAAIDALPMIAEKEVELHLVGGGDLEAELKARAANSSCAERIVFHGWLYGDQLQRQTAGAWLGLNLLDDSALNYRYSLANKFFDYMHAAVPSLNMDLPEYQSIVAEHAVGLMCQDLSPSTIANVINSITPQQYDDMVHAAEVASPLFCWDQEQHTLIRIISELH